MILFVCSSDTHVTSHVTDSFPCSDTDKWNGTQDNKGRGLVGVTGREHPMFLFRALGKILYCKSEELVSVVQCIIHSNIWYSFSTHYTHILTQNGSTIFFEKIRFFPGKFHIFFSRENFYLFFFPGKCVFFLRNFSFFPEKIFVFFPGKFHFFSFFSRENFIFFVFFPGKFHFFHFFPGKISFFSQENFIYFPGKFSFFPGKISFFSRENFSFFPGKISFFFREKNEIFPDKTMNYSLGVFFSKSEIFT